MKKSILLVMFALLSVAGFSQVSWNAKVGMNISNFTGDLDVSAKVGVKLGVGMEYAFNDTWLLQPSLFLSQKGAKFSATVSGDEADVKFNAMYFVSNMMVDLQSVVDIDPKEVGVTELVYYPVPRTGTSSARSP